MKQRSVAALLISASLSIGAQAAITVPGADGSDGALNITDNTVIDLSLATAGDGTTVKWDSPNTANAGNGLYDPKQWVVVFKYSSVTVAEGATLTFTNHPSRAPVMWLVSGDVTIDGTVSLTGEGAKSATLALNPDPGPGGFRGGFSAYGTGAPGGAGFGPGGGQHGQRGAAGRYAGVYGNPSIVPLIGGSGGGGCSYTGFDSGGAGGGAILIACVQTVEVDGTITARGGRDGRVYDPANTHSDRGSGPGSGGAIRIVTNQLTGTGTISAQGGAGYFYSGGSGRIRIERVTNDDSLTISPDPSVVALPAADTALVVPPAATAPTAKIISVKSGDDTAPAPDDPRAEFGATGADVTLPTPTGNTVIVTIETTGVEQESTVEVRLASRSGGTAITEDAALTEVVSTDPLVIRWVASIASRPGYAEMTARVIRP